MRVSKLLKILLGLCIALTFNGVIWAAPQTTPPTTGSPSAEELTPATQVSPPQVSAPTQPQQGRRVVRTIFSYRNVLGLTDAQVDKMRKILLDFQKFLIAKRADLQVAEIELREMINNGEDLGKIRKKLEEIERLRVEIRYTDIETARKIENVLTKDQLKRWREIQRANALISQ